MTETDFYKQLELQKKFDVDIDISKMMNEYCCEACKNSTKNLKITKEIFKKEIYEKIEKLQKIVDEHNNNLKNETLKQKLGLKLKNEKWLISYNRNYGWIYIKEEQSVMSMINNIDKIDSPGFRRCYVICPVCNYKHSFSIW